MYMRTVERLVEDFKTGQVTHLEELKLQLKISIRGVELQIPKVSAIHKDKELGIRVLNFQNH